MESVLSQIGFSLVRLGRGVPKSVSLFVSIAELVTQADKHALDECGELDEAEFDDLDESQKQELRQRYVASSYIASIKHVTCFC